MLRVLGADLGLPVLLRSVVASYSGSTRASVRVPASQQAARQRMAALWVAWLLGSLAVPLLRAHFFATETAAYRLQIFYYRCCLPHDASSTIMMPAALP